MQFKFDQNLDFQLEAIKSIVDVFEGAATEGSLRASVVSKNEDMLDFASTTTVAFGNQLTISESTVLENIKRIQKRNGLQQQEELLGPDFTVEMETGTGKTYVYLRTIFELNKAYGLRKFVVVVPSVAIREGVKQAWSQLSSHFAGIYETSNFGFFVYNSDSLGEVRSFAVNDRLEIMLINIDAFRRNLSEDGDPQKSTIFFRGRENIIPAELVQLTNPVVIIDEPQSVDNTELSKKAIQILNPLCKLRYSATHKDKYNLVYRLGPVKAFELGLVKEIYVQSSEVLGEVTGYVRLVSVDNKNGISAKIEINKKGVDSHQIIKVKAGDDIYIKSGELPEYENYVIEEISLDGIKIRGLEKIVRKGESTLIDLDEQSKRLQIKQTIEEHLNRELELRPFGIKVLSLFFLDEVSNYRVYEEDGTEVLGKYGVWFEEELKSLLAKEKYTGLYDWKVEELHNGYFAKDKSTGRYKNSKFEKSVKADDDAFDLIMKNKLKLLDMDEPLRFIFSHSALREGWDNPNVFQVCILSQTNSYFTRRQQIGRGLRLAVNKDGERVFDRNVNKLTVNARESYKKFAETLQKEYEEDCGEVFGKVNINTFVEAKIELNGVYLSEVQSENLLSFFVQKGCIDSVGRVTDKVTAGDMFFEVPAEFESVKAEIQDLLVNHKLERIIKKKENTKKLRLKQEVINGDHQIFNYLWEKISKKTKYIVNIDQKKLITESILKIQNIPKAEPVKILSTKTGIQIQSSGVTGQELRSVAVQLELTPVIPDILTYIEQSTDLTRKTIAKILIESGRLDDFKVNPQKFMDQVVDVILEVRQKLESENISYEPDGKMLDFRRIFDEVLTELDSEKLVEVNNSIYNSIYFDSTVERNFANELSKRQDVKLIIKLPTKFKIPTPVGHYSPDWAIVKSENDIDMLYLVRETKGSISDFDLREKEKIKINCGKSHFKAIGVDFAVVSAAREV